MLIWHSSKAQSPETTARHRTSHPTLPFLLPPHPPLLTGVTFSSLLLQPPEQCKKGVPLCLPLMTSMESDCAWNTTGRHRRRDRGIFYLFLELIGLGVIFTLALPSPLPFPAKDTVSWTYDTYRTANHHQSSITISPLPLQLPPRKTHMSKHTLIKNELQLEVNHIQIAVSEIRGKNEITYAKTQIVHNLRCHMRNTILRWHSPGFIWRRYIHD